MKTTLDSDSPLFHELTFLSQSKSRTPRNFRAKENGEVVVSKFHWISRPMGAKVNISNKEELFKILDQS